MGAAGWRLPTPASGRVGAQIGLISEVAAQGPRAGEAPGAAWAAVSGQPGEAEILAHRAGCARGVSLRICEKIELDHSKY